MTEEEALYGIALTQVPGVGQVLGRTLLSYCGNFKTVLSLPKAKLERIPGIGSIIAAALKRSVYLPEAEKIMTECKKLGISPIPISAVEYPSKLKEIPDAPLVIYKRGNHTLEANKTVGIVGTRQATAYGKSVTEALIKGIKPLNPLVISGLAFGIDTICHNCCLDEGLETAGVLAHGLHTVYPSHNLPLAKRMLEHGAIISEYPPGVKADPNNFPKRNRIIAGLADVIIVVEAAVGGGALITARLALDYNREVYAVPGSLGQKYSEGCNLIISNSEAKLFTTVEALCVDMGWSLSGGEGTGKPFLSKKPFVIPDGFAEEDKRILLKLKEADQLIDDLSFYTSIPISALASKLLALEFDGLVKSLPGKRFALKMD